jgi:hypothetical protein
MYQGAYKRRPYAGALTEVSEIESTAPNLLMLLMPLDDHRMPRLPGRPGPDSFRRTFEAMTVPPAGVADDVHYHHDGGQSAGPIHNLMPAILDKVRLTG